MKTLVLVDFDHTLYTKDSLIEFSKFYKGNTSFYLGMLKLIPTFLQWKLGIISNETAKKKYMTYFFKGQNYNHFLAKGNEFAITKINSNCNQNLVNTITNHQLNNDTVYIVTASFPEWIEAWTESKNFKIIGTQLEQINGIITGDFTSKNCYGIEKVNRIKAIVNLDLYDKIMVFGNGKGDFEMLQLQK